MTNKINSKNKAQSTIDSDAVMADDFFMELDKKYTKAGALLKGIRHREDMTQIQFAKTIDVSQSDLSCVP